MAVAREPLRDAPGRADDPLTEAQIRAGMAIMQTVYAVAMTLGFQVVVERSYSLVFDGRPAGHGPPVVVVLTAAVAVTSIGVRFFWVPRNIYSYLLAEHRESRHAVARNVVMIHFPVALLHAAIFSFVCEAWADVASRPATATLALRFTVLIGALLLVNAAWLWCITRELRGHDPVAAITTSAVWRDNNLMFGGAMVGLAVAAHLLGVSPVPILLATSALVLANGAIDLRTTAPDYLMLPGT